VTTATWASSIEIRGDLDQAEAMYRKSLGLFQEVGTAPKVELVRGLFERLRSDQRGR